MILVKLSAEDERTILKAKTLPELEGIRVMIIDRIERSKVLKAFGKQETVKTQTFRWQQAFDICKEVLGVGNVTVPPFPDHQWYATINLAIRRYGIDEEYTKKLAEYVKDHLRLPVQFGFLMRSSDRILNGHYDTGATVPKYEARGKTGAAYKPVGMQGGLNPMAAEMPDE